MIILVTAFDPFGEETTNPSRQIMERLPDSLGGARVIKKELPTIFSKSMEILKQEIETQKPDVVISLGQAGGRSCLTVERVAINIQDASVPDNACEKPEDTPIIEGGPCAYFTTLPVRKIVEKVRQNNLPCHLSYSAGTYVCNTVMYVALHIAAVENSGMWAGFLHLPFSTAQTVNKGLGTAGMSEEDMLKSVEAAILAVVEEWEGGRLEE